MSSQRNIFNFFGGRGGVGHGGGGGGGGGGEKEGSEKREGEQCWGNFFCLKNGGWGCVGKRGKIKDKLKKIYLKTFLSKDVFCVLLLNY